jgi:glycogen synthase
VSDSDSKPLKILQLSWEYPPRIVGGISRVVEGLSGALVDLGHEVHVITNEMPGSPAEDNENGVRVHRVPIESPTPSFHSWILMMNHYFSKKAGRINKEVGGFDIVHAHDWLVLPSGAEVKSFLGTTLVSTLHSLEFKRSGEVNTPESKMVDSLEWWATYESALVIVCSRSMRDDTVAHFRIPRDKIVEIPIGIDKDKFSGLRPNRDEVRARYGVFPDQKLILFVGRLTHQKGCEFLIRAIPFVAKYFDVKLVIVGDGYQRGELEYTAATSGVASRVQFAGFIADAELSNLFLCADVMVIPSVYEPFGVVALEGMAAGLPVVASNVDGLAEIIKHEENGLLVYPSQSSSIAWGISRILSDTINTERLIENARKDVEIHFDWKAVAKSTVAAYRRAIGND